jgi:threonine dehydratase
VVERADVVRAREVVDRHLRHTPTLTSRTLGARLKCELFQRTGSFKSRGALVKLASLDEAERARGVLTMSAGNHAQAVAYAAGEYGVDALVVMWDGASDQKLEATRNYGATVDLEATTPAEAFTRVAELRELTGRVFIHPHEDPFVLAGAGTIALEVEEDAPDADAIVVPVGGGGLIAGIVSALQGSSLRVIAVEAAESPALAAALAADGQQQVTPTSIADGLNVPIIGKPALELCRGLQRIVVDEEQIRDAFRFLYERGKLACEPAGAVATAAILSGEVDAERPVAVVSGGNVSAQTASDILV